MKKKIDLSVVIPAKNESLLIYTVIPKLATFLKNNSITYEIVLILNGTSDDSITKIQELKNNKKIFITFRNLKKGNIGKAFRKGIAIANGEYTLMLPIDELDLSSLKWAVKFRKHYDFIIFSKRIDRVSNNQTKYRRILSWGLNSILSIFTNFIGSDTHGMKLGKSNVLKKVAKRCQINRGQFDTELSIRIIRVGYKVAEIPVKYEEKRIPRDLMIVKIIRNIIDIIRLSRSLYNEPIKQSYFHRYSKYDIDYKKVIR